MRVGSLSNYRIEFCPFMTPTLRSNEVEWEILFTAIGITVTSWIRFVPIKIVQFSIEEHLAENPLRKSSSTNFSAICHFYSDRGQARFPREPRLARHLRHFYTKYIARNAAVSHCHIKYYLCSSAHKGGRLTRPDSRVRGTHAFNTTEPHIKHRGPRRSQSKNNIDPLFQPANKYRKYRVELSAPIFSKSRLRFSGSD